LGVNLVVDIRRKRTEANMIAAAHTASAGKLPDLLRRLSR
jgi:hypothetical protein